jgi:hypothetical protein
MRKIFKVVAVIILIALAVLTLSIVYFLQSRQAKDRALAAMQSDDQVEVATDTTAVMPPISHPAPTIAANIPLSISILYILIH